MVANPKTEIVARPAETTVWMRRIFDAPRPLVWEAITRPEHLRRWWGGSSDEAQLAVCEVDLRPGGRWRFVERSPDGTEFPFSGVYREVVPPTRLVHTFRFEDPEWRDREAVVTTTLEDVRGRTRMIQLTEFESVADRDAYVAAGAEKGMRISLNKLDELLKRLRSAGPPPLRRPAAT